MLLGGTEALHPDEKETGGISTLPVTEQTLIKTRGMYLFRSLAVQNFGFLISRIVLTRVSWVGYFCAPAEKGLQGRPRGQGADREWVGLRGQSLEGRSLEVEQGQARGSRAGLGEGPREGAGGRAEGRGKGAGLRDGQVLSDLVSILQKKYCVFHGLDILKSIG